MLTEWILIFTIIGHDQPIKIEIETEEACKVLLMKKIGGYPQCINRKTGIIFGLCGDTMKTYPYLKENHRVCEWGKS